MVYDLHILNAVGDITCLAGLPLALTKLVSRLTLRCNLWNSSPACLAVIDLPCFSSMWNEMYSKCSSLEMVGGLYLSVANSSKVNQ